MQTEPVKLRFLQYLKKLRKKFKKVAVPRLRNHLLETQIVGAVVGVGVIAVLVLVVGMRFYNRVLRFR